MPTFQTTPYMNWIFPDQAYYLNRKEGIMSSSIPPPLNESGHEVASHTHFSNMAIQNVMTRLSTNKRKELGMLGKLNTTERSQRHIRPASRSAVPNGIFTGPAMDYSANAGMRGGVIRTKEGREWLERRLQERKREYEAMATGQFRSRGTPETKTDVSPNTNEIDTFLQELFTALGTDVWNSRTTELSTKLLNAFFKEGAGLTEHQLARYSRIVDEIWQTTSNRSNDPGLGAFAGRTQEVARVLKFVAAYMKYCSKLIHAIMEVIHEPQNIRAMVIEHERGVILSKTEKILYPQSDLVPPPQMGPSVPPGPINPPIPRPRRLRRLTPEEAARFPLSEL